MSPRRRAELQVVLAALLFSTGGAAIKACALSSWQVAGFRSVIASVVILILLPAARRGWNWRTILVSLAYAATVVLFVAANKLTTAAHSILLQSTAPLYILLLAPVLLGEPLRRHDGGIMVLLLLGMLMLLSGTLQPQSTAPHPRTGNVLAAISGISWALTILGIRWLHTGRPRPTAGDGDHGTARAAPAVRAATTGAGRAAASTAPAANPTMAAVAFGNLIAFGFCLPWALPVTGATPIDWLAVAYLGIIQIGLAYLCLTAGMSRIPALETSILLLIEPVMNPIWTWMLHGETPGLWAVAGGALILTATVLKSALANRTVTATPPHRRES